MKNPITITKALIHKITIVPYLTFEEVNRIAEAAKQGRKGERNIGASKGKIIRNV